MEWTILISPIVSALIAVFGAYQAVNVVYLYAYNQNAARGVVSTRDVVGLTLWQIE